MANLDLIIEIGDDYTVVGYKGRLYKEASLIAFTKKGKRIQVQSFGNDAKQLIGKNDNNILIDAPFKYGVIVNMELAELYIRSLLDSVVGKRNFMTKLRVMLVTKCALESEEKRDFEIMSIKCDINQVFFMPSVLANAVGAGLDVMATDGKMIVEIGDGCTEIACISQGAIVNGYSVELGGSVIDSAIIDTINDKFGVLISAGTAETIKAEIGSLHPSDVANIEYEGVDALTRVSKSGTIFAKELFDVFSIAYAKICEAVEIALSQISADLINDISRNGIYLCGVGSRVTGLESFMKKYLNVPINILENEYCAIEGGDSILQNKKLLNTLLERN